MDEITHRRMESGDYDHWLNLDIRGVRIGNTGQVRWHIERDGDMVYDEQYVADVLEKVIMVIRKDCEDTGEIDGH